MRQLCCFLLLLLGVAASGLRADPSPVAAPGGGHGPLAVDPSRVRIISQTVASDELLLALAEPSQIVSLSHISRDARYSAVAQEAHSYPQLSPTCDAETALNMKPTLVLCADYSRAELVSQLRKAGIRVLIFSKYSTLQDSYENLRMLARELGPEAEVRAERVIAACERRVSALAQKLNGIRPVKVLAPSVYGMVPGDETAFQDLCDHAGAENLAKTLGGLRGHRPPPSERLLTWPIEQLVIGGEQFDAALAPFRTLPPYHFLPAVRQGRAVLVPTHVMSSISHRRVDGYEILARALHPELFPLTSTIPNAAAESEPPH